MGFEPILPKRKHFSRVPHHRSATRLRGERIEPSSVDFQSTVLPLNYPQYKYKYAYIYMLHAGLEPTPQGLQNPRSTY